MSKWYLGSGNDALFIINTPPRPSNDHPWHDRPDGPTMAICVHGLPDKRAEQIVLEHNKALDDLTQAKDAVIKLWNGTGESLKEADDVLRSISSYLGQGGMWDTENLDYKDVEQRIKAGIDEHIRVQAELLSRKQTQEA